ncbi:unnamed protein product, partial [Cyprideis torosa]
VNKKLPLVLTGLLIIGQIAYGGWRYTTHLTDYVDDVNLRIVNPAIDQATKFDPEEEDRIIATYLALSGRLLGEEKTSLENTQYLIWPESVFPFLVTERRDVLSAIAALLPEGTQLITGAMRAEPGAAADAKWIVNLTNDAWFGNTPGPWQHLRQSVVRAVEEGLPVVRVANRGVSGVIDPYGRLRATLPIREPSVTESALPKPAPLTVFARFHHLPFFGLLLACLAVSLIS